MSQATRPNDRHIIWSNQNLDVDDWRDGYKEFLEINELDADLGQQLASARTARSKVDPRMQRIDHDHPSRW